MKYGKLGNTGIVVSRICFGSLTIGPLQRNKSIDQGASIIAHGVDLGINFIDTAEYYDTYPYIKEAIRRTQKDLVVATKSYGYTREMMAKSLEKARKEMDKDIIDIFLLHEQESKLTIKGHWEAVEYLLKAKDQGKVRAVGISTHTIAGVLGALDLPQLEIIHPIVNYQGLGIQDGSIESMLAGLELGKNMGKGIYGMKPIGGGNLINNAYKAMKWAFSREEIASVAVGMQSIEEVNINVAWLLDQKVNQKDLDKISQRRREISIGDYCTGCGQCLAKCTFQALKVANGRARVDEEKCILCGYCGGVCPEFAIKII